MYKMELSTVSGFDHSQGDKHIIPFDNLITWMYPMNLHIYLHIQLYMNRSYYSGNETYLV